MKTTNTTIDAAQIDRLGVLLAQISDLSKEASKIKTALKDQKQNVFEGNLFRAVVVDQERTTYDTDVLKAIAPPEILELAMRESVQQQVRVTARRAV
jgi:hypothetical protein